MIKTKGLNNCFLHLSTLSRVPRSACAYTIYTRYVHTYICIDAHVYALIPESRISWLLICMCYIHVLRNVSGTHTSFIAAVFIFLLSFLRLRFSLNLASSLSVIKAFFAFLKDFLWNLDWMWLATSDAEINNFSGQCRHRKPYLPYVCTYTYMYTCVHMDLVVYIYMSVCIYIYIGRCVIAFCLFIRNTCILKIGSLAGNKMHRIHLARYITNPCYIVKPNGKCYLQDHY